jgi:hypothetical protein
MACSSRRNKERDKHAGVATYGLLDKPQERRNNELQQFECDLRAVACSMSR